MSIALLLNLFGFFLFSLMFLKCPEKLKFKVLRKRKRVLWLQKLLFLKKCSKFSDTHISS